LRRVLKKIHSELWNFKGKPLLKPSDQAGLGVGDL